jgi:ribonuclease PH
VHFFAEHQMPELPMLMMCRILQATRPMSRQAEQFLHDALSAVLLLDRYPKAVFDVSVLVLEAAGSVLSAAVMAAGLAAADAAVEMRCVLTAATVVRSLTSHLLDLSLLTTAT